MDYEQWDRSLTIIILIGLAVLAFFVVWDYNSYNNYLQNQNYTNGTGRPILSDKDALKTPTNISTVIINMSILTVEDQKLLSIIKEGESKIGNDVKGAIDASRNNDSRAFESSGINIQRDSAIYLNITENIHVSSHFQVISDEYKISLQKFYSGGKYIQSSAINPGDVNVSIDYINAGFVHLSNINTVLENSNTSKSNNNANNRFLHGKN